MIATAILLIFLVLLLLLAKQSIIIVRQAEVMVIERLGKFSRILYPGLNFIIPGLEEPRPVEGGLQPDLEGEKPRKGKVKNTIDLREKIYDFPPQNVITKDNVYTGIDALLYYEITDPKRVVYAIDNFSNALEKLAQTSLRSIIGEMTLDETLSSRDSVNIKLRKILDEATEKWGVKVNRVEVEDITPPREVLDEMERVMRAERERRAAVTRAEGEKRAAVLRSEGEAYARIRISQAEAEAIRRISDTLREVNADPTKYLIAIRYLDSLKEMVTGKDNKIVYLPYEATGVLGSLGGIKELFDDLNVNKSGGKHGVHKQDQGLAGTGASS